VPERTLVDPYQATTQIFDSAPFSTDDFIAQLSAQFPDAWLAVVERYGAGGRGAGRYFTSNSFVGQRLAQLVRKGHLERLGYSPAPAGWGNNVIQFWRNSERRSSRSKTSKVGIALPEWTDSEFREGGRRLRTHLVRERSAGLRNAKLAWFRKDNHGRIFCESCSFDPVGDPIKEAAIEIHHAIIAISKMEERQITKLSDLKCLCANCHRIVHAEERERNRPAANITP
jgi:hypothetical protein